MAYCGVKPSCGFNKAGERVRVCKKHRYLRTTAQGEKLKTAEPKREYHDQAKYYEKYRTKAWIKKKAAKGSKRAQAQLEKMMGERKAVKREVKALKATKPAPSPDHKALKSPKATKAASATAEQARQKELKAARDKRYRENKRKKEGKGEAPTTAPPSPSLPEEAAALSESTE